MDIDELLKFLLLEKMISPLCEAKIPFLSFTCEDIDVVMVEVLLAIREQR